MYDEVNRFKQSVVQNDVESNAAAGPDKFHTVGSRKCRSQCGNIGQPGHISWMGMISVLNLLAVECMVTSH